MVPLSTQSSPELAAALYRDHPAWAGVRVSGHARYLGFVLGPERGEIAFDKPLEKFAARARAWGAVGGGLLLTSLAYAVYILPVISFLLQLDGLPEAWGRAEAAAFRALVPGPGEWCGPEDLRSLRRFGFPGESPDAREVSLACRFRVAHREALPDGLQVTTRSRLLRIWMADSVNAVRRARWSAHAGKQRPRRRCRREGREDCRDRWEYHRIPARRQTLLLF